ncbi:MAG: FAD-binding oxidoreductase [Bacillota bacterium]
MRSADVVIIGAGVHGASAAYHLAKAGKEVLLLEKTHPGSGASGVSGGIIRCHYSNESMVRLAHRAAERWPSLADELGGPTDYVHNGLIMLVAPEDADTLRRVVEMQQRLGVRTRVIELSEVERHLPGLNPDGLALACIEESAGYADPYAATQAFIGAARRLGAQVELETPVTGFEVAGGRVRAVETPRGTIRCDYVINAAGAWARRVGELVGLDLPVHPGIVQMAAFRPGFAGYTGTSPTWVDLTTLTYCRPDRGGLALCGGGTGENEALVSEEPDPDHFNPHPPLLFEAEMAENLGRRFKWLAGIPKVRSWAGVDGISPDFHLIFGEMPGLKGFINVIGGSGNSFKLSPATGEAVSELIVHGECSHLDMQAFSIDRFEAGRPFRGKYRMHIVG